jgi:signal peptidase
MKKVLFMGVPFVLLVVFLVFLRPVPFHGDTSYVVVVGHSMEPTLRTAIVKKQRQYAVGDIIAYRAARGQIVIHRIVDKNDGGFITQGDNKEYPDPWNVAQDAIEGVSIFQIPKVGLFLNALSKPVNLSLFLVGLFAMFSLPGILLATPEWSGRKRRQGRKERVKRRRIERALIHWLPLPLARVISKW